MALNEGVPAPDFTLPTDGGGSLTLSGLRGRKVVLYAYPQDDTTSCTNEALSFDALRDDFAAAGTSVIGISPDSVKRHDKFKQKYGLQLTLVSDEERKAIEAYGLWVEKQMYGRHYMGVERSTFLIDEAGRIVRVWAKVRVKGHAEAVLAAAREI
ncbi:putative peroxiredoxin bcp [Bosea sp. 62]|uniref:peroxiredoxin n=1 Tax=unclassified Bosea (in: a-proteobacteria) TaxID=2653178 RepID=UPI0012527AE2|nr:MULTISPECIES: peroxiredoxin [unclassified Bosea (in: a-proteobacteria)]CAD5260264.1 putative peroxiredoxin bcp [Bosea sp. 46]CAD5264755.1 putative peroxiredoxin bcp [Bosea sp. 21B]CAD5275572.1 putative peroxiredoxin bcp [Bosea sp. 7B]VVT59140.1 putative peroxiredoxin bcp [Bosea sp. EC-HK365B]VXB70951.1 putative peroxiredoxin bcp [Bosea sp. 29B]